MELGKRDVQRTLVRSAVGEVAKGQMIDGVATGYWEWFRKDGTKLRLGYFEKGTQVGEWTTYDMNGEVYKVTAMKRRGK